MTRVNPPETLNRRIAVILGGIGSSTRLLEQILPLLGSNRDIEMQGVFLEEAEVQHAAELPFVQELCRVTFSVREFNSDQFEHALKLRMRTARKALSVLTRRTGVTHSFRNVRSSAVTLLRETAADSDITVFEPVRLSVSALSQVIPSPSQRRIIVLIDDPATAAMSLITAARLAGGRSGQVMVIMSSRLAEDRAGLQQHLGGYFSALPQIRVVAGGLEELLEAARCEPASMLVLGVSEDTLNPELLRTLRERQSCPVCLVRRWNEGPAGD